MQFCQRVAKVSSSKMHYGDARGRRGECKDYMSNWFFTVGAYGLGRVFYFVQQVSVKPVCQIKGIYSDVSTNHLHIVYKHHVA